MKTDIIDGHVSDGERNGPEPVKARSQPRLRRITFDGPVDADYVVYRLEEAGATLLALPGYWLDNADAKLFDRNCPDGVGSIWMGSSANPTNGVPSADKIDRMDEAMAWIPLIPQDRYVLRRVVGARSLVHPITDRHLYTWRRLGVALGADHKAVQRWHSQGIAMIVAALHRLD